MARKLAVLFDGTWNTTKDRTNVIRLCELTPTTECHVGVYIPSATPLPRIRVCVAGTKSTPPGNGPFNRCPKLWKENQRYAIIPPPRGIEERRDCKWSQ